MFDYKDTDRYKECQKCESFVEDKNTCGECGCYLPPKVLIPITSCPLNKWK